MTNKVKMPWKNSTGGIPLYLDYFEGTMFEKVKKAAEEHPNFIAYDFMGSSTNYREFVRQIEKCAKALRMIGVRENDKVTIAMPNCPQALIMFYAANLAGAITNMVHPLSSEEELVFYINNVKSETLLTLDQFYNKIEAIRDRTTLKNVIIARIKDALSKPLRYGYMLTEGRKIKRIPDTAPVIMWNNFMSLGNTKFFQPDIKRKSTDPAVILYSGGTTGVNKGILLTNKNFNALSQQIVGANPMYQPGDKVLAVMPIFHGFGLGVSIHSFLSNGGRCVLVPRFTPKSYAKDLVKHKCNFVAGVPTLFEALLRLPDFKKANLSFLKGVFSGGDSLSIELKKKLDTFLYEHHAVIQVREGYGTTETVTACCLTPVNFYKEGSIGIPLPDVYMKIVKLGTDEELPYGEEGEILLAGPTVMKEYIGHPEETAQTLRVSETDGMTWVYTGDLGVMDEDGFTYFKGRAKRMIVTNGYNVYPAQLENILDANELISMSCVIGVPDEMRIEKVKAFVVLKPDVPPTEGTRQAILDYAKKHIAKYAMPREIEFRDELPKTLVGKVAYRVLEQEEAEKREALKKVLEQEKEN